MAPDHNVSVGAQREATPPHSVAEPFAPASLDRYVQAATAAFAVEPASRSPQWALRLRLNAPELRQIHEAQCLEDSVPIGLPVYAPTAGPYRTDATGPQARGIALTARRVAQGLEDPVERVERALAAAQRHGSLNAMQQLDAVGATRKAAELRARIASGAAAGRLAGIVVAVKDCFDVAGLPVTAGTRSMPVRTALQSAPSVERLEREGAIVIGMTTMHELAYGGTTDNPHFGRVRHPLDGELIVGGSSGGSAVAVACEMADVALGTDTAGSVRMPAALCGLTGYKPSFGLVSTDGVLPLAWSLDHVGMLTRSVGDQSLLAEIMGALPEGSLTLPAACAAEVHAIEAAGYFTDIAGADVLRVYQAALDKLAQAGVCIGKRAIEGLELAPTLQFLTLCAEASEVHEDRALRNPDGIGDEVRVRLEAGRFLRAVDYIKAQRLRSELRAALSAPLAERGAVWVGPTVLMAACAPAPSVELQGRTVPIHVALTRCTLPFNLTGMPAISIPCGTTPQGLPVGLQLAGRHGCDAELLAVAALVESVLRAEP